MDRRSMLRTAGRLGVALGTIPLIGASHASSITGTDSGTDGTGGTGGAPRTAWPRSRRRALVLTRGMARMARTRFSLYSSGVAN